MREVLFVNGINIVEACNGIVQRNFDYRKSINPTPRLIGKKYIGFLQSRNLITQSDHQPADDLLWK